MARHQGPVLVDTNAVLECWCIGAWRALAGGYSLETVEDCVTETQTGFQRRKKEQQVDVKVLCNSLAAPAHKVVDVQLAELTVRAPDIALDIGERSLWAHALTRKDNWVLCGPDRASLRMGVRLGLRERMISLERLLVEVGYHGTNALKTHYTTKWLNTVLGEMVVLEEHRRP